MEERTLLKNRFDRQEAASYLGVSTVTVDRAVAGKKIDHYKIGRRVVFSKGHLDTFLERCEVKAKRTYRGF